MDLTPFTLSKEARLRSGPGFQELLQGLSPTLTAPSFASLCTLVSGWLFSGRGVVTRMIVAAGSGATQHFSSYHRLLNAASWSLDAMGLAVSTMIEPFLGDVVMLGLDDTLARKRGLRMFGTGMHHDPLSSTRSLAFVRWGHSWVVLGVIVDFPFRPGHWIFLPLLFRLYGNRQTVAKQRLPGPADMLAGRCRRISLAIYGRSYRSRITDQVARVFAVPDRPLRIVASEALKGGRGREAFYSTCHEATAEQVICWYAMRWSVEVAFRDSKQCLGFEEPQGWSRKAVALAA